jgi:hypothetical protein
VSASVFDEMTINYLSDAALFKQRVIELGGYIQQTRQGEFKIQCPHPDHADTNPSGSLKITDGNQAVIHCFSCTNSNTTDWIESVQQRLNSGTVFVQASPKSTKSGTGSSGARGSLVESYSYVSQSGKNYLKDRFVDDAGGKTFGWRREYGDAYADGLGVGVTASDMLPYRSPEYPEADQRPILWVEGEKDANAAAALGHRALTSASSKTVPKCLTELEDQDVVIVADNDPAGKNYAILIKNALDPIAKSVTLAMVIPDHKGADLSDHLQAGYSVDDLVLLGVNAAEELSTSLSEDGVVASLELLTRSDLAKLPKPSPLIADTIDLNTLIVLAGTFGTFKSFIVLDWLACIATGKPWQGREVTQGKVLYVAGEGVYGIHDRLHSWEKGWGRRISDEDFFVIRQSMKLHRPSDQALMRQLVQEIQPKLVVFDTLSRTAVGLEENSATDMGLLMDDALRLMSSVDNMSVLFVHHTGKDKKTIRGSSVLEANVDTVYLSEGDEAGVSLTRIKRKDGVTHDLSRLKFRQIEGTSSGVMESGVGVDTSKRAERLLSTFLTTFSATGATKKELEIASGIARTTFNRAINDAIREGLLVNTGTDKRPFYRLGEGVSGEDLA